MDFSDDLITKLNSDLANPKWKDELTDLFDESPGDVKDIWKALKEDADTHWELYDNDGFIPDSRWEKWSKREFFKDVTGKGKYFENNYLVPQFIKRPPASAYSDEYLQLRNKAMNEFDVDLDEFDMYTSVQLKYPEPITLPSGKVIEYFVADQVYVKWGKAADGFTDEIKDIVVIENKLKLGTQLTPNQNAGKNAESLITKSEPSDPLSPVSGIELPKNVSLPSNNKWLKVFDNNDGNVISGIEKL